MKILITILQEQKDGSADAVLNYDKEAGKFIRERYNVKRITKKVLQKLVNEAIEGYLEKEGK